MEFKEAIKLAQQSLWANKLRSVLTLLGVVIGVASVIAVVTLVNGANTYVTTKFSSYGADVFTVSKMPQIITSSQDYQRFQKRKDILLPDFQYIKDNCEHCVGIGAMQSTTAKVVRGTQSVTDTRIRGYTSQMLLLQNLNIEQGRGFTDIDEERYLIFPAI
jgi:putative ABC transport system permease protein